jgi:glycosyltransferase involved in cell wall biosynthesis/SAM-dependent methyltransferase
VDQALADEPADVLHLQQPLSALGALRTKGAKRLPILYTFHSPAPLEYASRAGMTGLHRTGPVGRAAQLILWAVERTCLRRATRIHVLSDFSADLLWKLYRISSDRIVKIPGGVDTDRFRPAPDRPLLRKALGLPIESPLLLTIRNLEARMGLDTLIRAMAILRGQAPDVTLLIGGAGSLRSSLEILSASLDLQQHVRFLGYIPESDLPRYYQAADAFVLPTRELEGFGLVTVEALACGTPVLGTAVGATPEILLPLDPKLILQDTAPEAMADNLARFLAASQSQHEAAPSLRQACRRHAELHYGWDGSVARLEETLDRLARDRREPVAARACPGCGGPIGEPDLVYRGAPYLRCPCCRTSAVKTLPTAVSLRRQYEREYPHEFHPEHVSEPRAELFDSILDRLELFGAWGRILDVGCGGGHLLGSADRRGWRGLGTDLSQQACAATFGRGVSAVQADGSALPFRDASIDAVSLINVLDHIPDPLTTLREAYRVLRPGGRVAIRIPNAAFHRPCVRLFASLGPLARLRRWDGYPILHLYAFPPDGLRSLIHRTGFGLLEIRNSSLTAEEFLSRGKGLRGVLLRLLRRVIAGGAAGVALLSRGRWLVGPSIELYAERPPTGSVGKP